MPTIPCCSSCRISCEPTSVPIALWTSIGAELTLCATGADVLRSTFVYVEDLVSAILSAMQKLAAGTLGSHTVFNVGGPDRLSRYDLALLVASVCKLDTACIVGKEQAKATLEYPRPPDLTLSNSLVRSVLGVEGTPIRTVVERVCGASHSG